jgi:hypothetical protein
MAVLFEEMLDFTSKYCANKINMKEGMMLRLTPVQNKLFLSRNLVRTDGLK